MLRKIKNVTLALFLPLMLAAPLALAPVGSASAADLPGTNCTSNVGALASGTNSALGGNGACNTVDQNGVSDLQTLAKKIVNFLSVIVGIVAVIMIIVGGFKYITSGGESSNVSGAKNTLIYAIVGLIIVALAQFIVRFVLSNVANV